MTTQEKLEELSAVLWFLVSLTTDHEPLCTIKDSVSGCNCDVTIKEDDPLWLRARKALFLPNEIKEELADLLEELG
jgi:hypothetical protein